MAVEEIPDANGDNAFKGGFLDRKFCNLVTDRINRKYRVSCNNSQGQAKFIVTEDDIVLDLTKFNGSGSAASAVHRLSVVNASTSSAGVVTPKVRVYLGYVANRLADPTMTDVTDTPPFILTLASAVATKYIICAVTMAYDTATGIWSSTACAIGASSTITADTSTIAYIPLAVVQVVAVTGGYSVNISSTGQMVSGDQYVVRTPGASNTSHTNGLI